MLDHRLIGARIQAARTVQGLTLEQAAGSAHLSPDILRAFETGTRKLTVEALCNLCYALGVGPDLLVRGRID